MRFALVVRSMLFAILLMGVAGAVSAQVRVAIAVGPPVAAGLRAADLSRRRLFLDARILGL
jgi:hypothetical protein